VMLWQADALLLVGAVAGVLGRSAPHARTWGWCAAAVAGVVVLARRRFARADRPVFGDPPDLEDGRAGT
ncbi:MAG: hypothetical protein ACTMIR_00610, partial [Cellulomonadaceae bacterium]